MSTVIPAGTGDATYVSSEMMDEAPEYFGWMLSKMRSHLHGHLAEVGCGFAVATEALASLETVDHVTAIDIDPAVIDRNRLTVRNAKVTFLCADFAMVPEASFDSVLCANVVEHIRDDVTAARALWSMLKPGGTLAFLVPAHPALFTIYDRAAGHERRYTRRGVEQLLTGAGFRIDRLFLFNILGAVGWWISFKILQPTEIRQGQSRFLIRFFQRFVLPVGRMLETVWHPPVGLSVIALCTKP